MPLDEINKIYDEVKDLGSYLTEYNIAKSNLKNCENEIEIAEQALHSSNLISNKDNLENLEKELFDILSEIKKIDLCTKECLKLSEIKAMFEFIDDQDLLQKKCINFLSYLIYDVYIGKENFVKFFIQENNLNASLIADTYKVVKVSNDLDELFTIVINESMQDIYDKCFFSCKLALEDMLDNVLPEELFVYVDDNYFYVVFASEQKFDLNDEVYFSSLRYENVSFLKTKRNLLTIFYNIFKQNLIDRLLSNDVFNKSIDNTNVFFKDSEYFITNVNEWALDCVMKELIIISKTQKSNNIIETSNVKIASLISRVDQKFLPAYISQEMFKFLLCINVFDTIKSSRTIKATKIIERALYKLLTQDKSFITFADNTLCLRIFSHLSIVSQLFNIREALYNELTIKSTELTKNLQDSLILLKVYFKGIYYDFTESITKFVPKSSHLSFEITFFNLLYTNVIHSIMCINFLTSEKTADLNELVKYLLEMSFNIPKESISIYPKMLSISKLFQCNLEDLISMYKKNEIFLDKKELKKLILLIFKESKKRDKFINCL